MAEQHGDGLAELEERYAGYEVYDRDGERIGRVDDLFVDENDRLEYVGVKMGLLETRSILIPMDAARVDERWRVIEVSQPKSKVQEGPTFDNADEITPEFEERVRNYYELESLRSTAEQDADEESSHIELAEDSERRPDTATGDFGEERGEVREHPASVDREAATRREAEPSLAGYQVYDRHYEKIGKIDDLFVDENNRPEYIGVKMGFLGTRSTLIPMDIVRVNDRRRLVEVEADKDKIQDGPTFGDDREITSEFQQRVLSYYQVETAQASAERGAYGPYSDATGDEQVDVLPGERAGAHERLDEGQLGDEARDAARERSSGLADEDELGASPPERQAGDVNIRGRMPADRQRPAEPESREEVPDDRPAVEGREDSEGEIGDDATRRPDR
ncbi:MAG: PRC-barrel domain-containing protein [Actinomycetota bacterium]|nr:PRC-barrel domain-containing protein [Actinomycetota bacterium]